MTSGLGHKVTLGSRWVYPFSHCAGFVTNRRLLLSGSGTHSLYGTLSQYSPPLDAMGRVLYSWKDLQDLAGYTARVSELMDTMSDIRTANFEKSMIGSASEEENVKCEFAWRQSKVFSFTTSPQCCRATAKSSSLKRSSSKTSLS